MMKLRRSKLYKDWYHLEAYLNSNHYRFLTIGLSKQFLEELREAIDLLLKWEE